MSEDEALTANERSEFESFVFVSDWGEPRLLLGLPLAGLPTARVAFKPIRQPLDGLKPILDVSPPTL